MGENQQRILQMLAEGKISVEEATRLLSLVTGEGDGGGAATEAKPTPKYLYVRVEPKAGAHHNAGCGGHHSLAEHGRVNVRIPVGLIRAGMKLGSLIPEQAADDVNRAMKEKGIGFDIRNLKDEYVEELIGALSETEINVDSEEAEIRVHTE